MSAPTPERSATAPRRITAVSAVVCNFNGEEYLRDCLAALDQLDPGIDEIIVVDNASTDGGVDIVRAEYPHVRLVLLSDNAGPCNARNVGMRAARNRWVLAVDNDAVPRPDVLGLLVAAAEADSGAVIVQPRSVFSDDNERVHYDGAWFHYVGLLSLRNFYKPIADSEGIGVVPVDGAISMTLLLDRDVVMEQGGYDSSYFILFEDYDLSLRLRMLGHRILSVENAIVLHMGGTAGISFRSGSYPQRRAFFHARNRWILLFKNHSWRTLIVSFPGLLVYELVWLAFTIKSGHLSSWVRGKWAFVRQLPELSKRRAQIQGQRRVSDRELLVGGPLTLSPELLDSPFKGGLVRALNAILNAWWSVARHFAA